MRRACLLLLALAACSKAPDENQASAPDMMNETHAVAVGELPIFDSIGELTKPDEVDTKLRNARIADPKYWQASFYIQSAGGMCTATLVGDRVLLTAAHCVGNGAAVGFRRAGVVYQAKCDHAPEYAGPGPNAKTTDYALCLVDKSIPGIAPERVNESAARLKVNDPILLTGFGCTTNQGTGGNDGQYRIGESDIKALPSGANNDIVTADKAGLCFGDSGGPAFLGTETGPRVQVSVNSRVENRSATGTDLGPKSYLSSLTSLQGSAFLKSWSAKTGMRICGLDRQAAPCHP